MTYSISSFGVTVSIIFENTGTVSFDQLITARKLIEELDSELKYKEEERRKINFEIIKNKLEEL